MITVINGNILEANQLAEELGRVWFGAKFYHWHGADFEKIRTAFNIRDEKLKGAYIRNCNDAKDLEVLIAKFDKEEVIINDSFSLIITTCCLFDEPVFKGASDNGLWKLPLFHNFKLITVKQF